jgi:hypothetical protein
MRRFAMTAVALIAVAPSAPAQPTAPSRVGDFTYVDRSDMGQIVAYTNAVNRTGYLAWACVRGELKIYLSPGRSLGDEYWVEVAWQQEDEEAAGSYEWSLTDGGRGAYAPEEAIASLTASARVTKTVVLELTGKQVYKFRLEGLGKALEMLPCTLDPPESAVSLADE